MPQPFSGKWQFLRNRISFFLYVLNLDAPSNGVFLMWYLSKFFLGDIPRYPFLIRAISDAPSTKFGTLEIIAILLPPPMRPPPRVF